MGLNNITSEKSIPGVNHLSLNPHVYNQVTAINVWHYYFSPEVISSSSAIMTHLSGVMKNSACLALFHSQRLKTVFQKAIRFYEICSFQRMSMTFWSTLVIFNLCFIHFKLYFQHENIWKLRNALANVNFWLNELYAWNSEFELFFKVSRGILK